MERITLPIEKLPARQRARRWPSLSVILVGVGVVLIVMAWLGH